MYVSSIRLNLRFCHVMLMSARQDSTQCQHQPML